MSSRTEQLLEKINMMEKQAREIEERGEDPLSIQRELVKLREELTRANQVLSESRNVLKG